MKKLKYAVLALLCAALVTGCAQENTDNTETGTTTSAAVTEQTEEKEADAEEKTETEEKAETEKTSSEDEKKEKPETLLDLQVRQLDDIELVCQKHINESEHDNNYYYISGMLSDFKILTRYAVELIDRRTTVRKGTGFVFLDEKGADIPVNDIMDPIEWETSYSIESEGLYEGVNFNSPIAVVDTSDGIGWTIKTDEIIFSCDFHEKEITGFIRQIEPGLYEIYPDPAYCHGMPMLHKTGGDCYRRINDLSVYMDSPVIYSSLVSEKLDGVGDKFVYAKMKLDSKLIYSTKDGYINDAKFTDITGVDYVGSKYDHLYSFEILSEDTESVLTSDFTPKETEGEAYETYKVLAESFDTLAKEDTVGVILADLDFDGVPEVISTREIAEDTEMWTNYSSEADIYRIRDGALVYIDTIKTGGGSRETFISSGLDHNNKPAWVYMPADENVFCRTFKLEGDKLVYEDIFGSYNDGENIVNTYLGNDITAEATGATMEYGNTEYGYEIYTCKGYDLAEIKGDPYYVVGMAQEDYFNRFDKIYNLYAAPFMHLDENHPGFGTFTKLYPESRAYTYGMAYLVDSYFNGEYISEAGGYSYHFYGDYEKPVIYLYPEKETEVSVEVSLKDGGLTCTYPDYGDGWRVTAYPDGTLINSADGREYSYLYWEGEGKVQWDMSEGFCVKGSDTAAFLQEKLEFMGLTPREYNEFIVYWLPLMQENEYNLITFQQEAYTDMAQLKISPEPDSMLRVFMTFKALDEPAEVSEQKLEKFERTGFAAVEWGGCEVG